MLNFSSILVIITLWIIPNYASLLTITGTLFSNSNSTISRRSRHHAPCQHEPILPNRFKTNWTIYYYPMEDPWPPYQTAPPAPHSMGRGYSVYDNFLPAMAEVFFDECLPIFPVRNHWPCTFLNRGTTAYLISPDWAPLGPCCIFGNPWHTPRPNFIHVVPFNRTEVFHEKIVDWFVLGGRYPAPFGYGFYRQKLSQGESIPAAFWFRGNEGWGHQDFNSFDYMKADEYDFSLPAQCENAAGCIFR
ncbi:uncharacterized protein LOC141908468 [Tubulanus polymorphus]|uniref:uncharacterized protein LOC141908468 n=1 Tax=Tubulanus polymorphus TaxID=672921 RepID=UPI003DA61363